MFVSLNQKNVNVYLEGKILSFSRIKLEKLMNLVMGYNTCSSRTQCIAEPSF